MKNNKGIKSYGRDVLFLLLELTRLEKHNESKATTSVRSKNIYIAIS